MDVINAPDRTHMTSAVAEDLVQIAYEEHVKNVELALVHVRDARNMLAAVAQLKENRALSKATILLAAASLESNLTYLSGLALQFIDARPGKFQQARDAR
jgi:hypothetical protein